MHGNLSHLDRFSKGDFRFSLHNGQMGATTRVERDHAADLDALLAPYTPRLVRSWSNELDGPRARTIEGSLVSVDISGFTALAERLAVKGKAGAEELVQRISSVFDDLITVAERHGGDV